MTATVSPKRTSPGTVLLDIWLYPTVHTGKFTSLDPDAELKNKWRPYSTLQMRLARRVSCQRWCKVCDWPGPVIQWCIFYESVVYRLDMNRTAALQTSSGLYCACRNWFLHMDQSVRNIRPARFSETMTPYLAGANQGSQQHADQNTGKEHIVMPHWNRIPKAELH